MAGIGFFYDGADIANCGMSWLRWGGHDHVDGGDLAWDCGAAVPVAGSFGRAGRRANDVIGGGARKGADDAASAFDDLAHSSSGIQSYRAQKAVTRGRGGEIQAHHLIERRFANVMGGSTDDWASIVVTRAEHQQFTTAWRRAIPYGAGTRTATRTQVEEAARRIYADYPEILRALGLG